MKYFRWWAIFLCMAAIVGMLSSPPAKAFDSSSAFNVVTMSYTANTTIYQNIVLNSTQQAASSIKFSVDVKNGGGRPTTNLAGYPNAGTLYTTQTDSAWVTIYAYNSSGGLVGSQTSQQYVLQNYGTNAGWSNAPGDNLIPWSTATVTYNGSLSNVAYIKVEMKGTDGAWWAGNYGPEWRTPTVTVGSSTQNIVYNPEFGIAPNSVKAQGWTTSSGSWSSCGVTSGSLSCVTAVSGVTANEWGGGYSATGGTTSGQVGGYTSTLSVTTADTAATTGDPGSGSTTTTTTPTLCCGGSADPFSASQANVTKVQTFMSRTTGDSKVSIEQIGNFNITTIDQTGTKNNYVNYYVNGSSNVVNIKQTANNNTQTNYVDLSITGNSNTVDIKQRTSNETASFGKGAFVNIANNNNSVIIDQQNSGSHYAEVNLSGGNKTVEISQSGSANHMASVTLSGQPTNLSLTQTGTTQQFYSITHNCATSGGCAAITVTQGN